MQKLRLGLFGAGHLGKIHLKCALMSLHWQVVGFFEPDDAAAAAAESLYQVPRFATEQDLLDAVDAVDIVTPTPTHFELVSKALQQKKHVFVEKPLTHTVDEARILLDIARASGCWVQVGHVERFNPAFQALDGVELRPMFIESHRLAAFQPRGTDVSVVLDLMIHDLDLVLHLVKSPLKKVSASGVAVMSDTPDIANARLEFENGAVANLTASRISMKQMRKMRIFQPDTYISLDFFEKQAQILRLFATDADDLPPQEQLMEFDTPKGKKWLSMKMPEVESNNAILAELDAFAHAITTNTRPIVAIEDGFAALEVAHEILAAIESAWKAYLVSG